jgi:hypothetical protein
MRPVAIFEHLFEMNGQRRQKRIPDKDLSFFNCTKAPSVPNFSAKSRHFKAIMTHGSFPFVGRPAAFIDFKYERSN